MEEIWNYGVNYRDGKVHLAVWGSGVLEYDVATGRWKDYLDPDGEMEIDLYRDDGIIHVITTAVGYIDKVMWVSTYFGVCRYDGRHWRGYYNMDSGTPSDFINNLKARSGNEAYFATDKGIGAIMDFDSNTWVTYTRDAKATDRQGRRVPRPRGAGDRRDRAEHPAQLHHRGGCRRTGHLGGNLQGSRLGHRRRLLSRAQGTPDAGCGEQRSREMRRDWLRFARGGLPGRSARRQDSSEEDARPIRRR